MNGEASKKVTILFLCTGNSCRSQMAEGWAHRLNGKEIEAFSAGTKPHRIDSRAIQVMRESGVDISKQYSKPVDALAGKHFDYVMTVCDSANETCPIFPVATKRLHVSFEDPPRLAAAAQSEDEALQVYRKVRDKIRVFIETLPEGLSNGEEN